MFECMGPNPAGKVNQGSTNRDLSEKDSQTLRCCKRRVRCHSLYKYKVNKGKHAGYVLSFCLEELWSLPFLTAVTLLFTLKLDRLRSFWMLQVLGSSSTCLPLWIYKAYSFHMGPTEYPTIWRPNLGVIALRNIKCAWGTLGIAILIQSEGQRCSQWTIMLLMVVSSVV